MRRLITDLPGPAIRSIIQRARPRCIAGTNRFVLVCRSWRDVSSDTDDSEQLQLVLDLDNLNDADLASCLAWLRQHGSCVTALFISSIATHGWPVLQQLLVAPTTWSSNLTRLELEGEDTLVPLAPHLQQLPSLQHLKASIGFCDGGNGRRCCYDIEGMQLEVPDLRQLCPQLAGMHVTVQVIGPTWFSDTPDDRLPRLVPLGLQQLHLESMELTLDCSDLTQLTALSALTLEVYTITSQEQLETMDGLQQLVLASEHPPGDLELLPLASKLVGLWGANTPFPSAVLRQLTGLTALATMSVYGGDLSQEEEEQQQQQQRQPLEGSPLSCLKALQHLSYVTSGGSSKVLAGLSSISSLRSLTLNGVLDSEAAQLLGQVSQVTSLELLLWGQDMYTMTSQVVQQLTGLQRLVVGQGWMMECGRELSALQQLTQLVVKQGMGDPFLDVWEQLAPVHSSLARLQHVVYQGAAPDPIWPERVVPPLEWMDVLLPGVRITILDRNVELPEQYGALRPRHTRPCPHLPGVWEVVPPG